MCVNTGKLDGTLKRWRMAVSCAFHLCCILHIMYPMKQYDGLILTI
jgi:hypothetical protein